MKDTISKVAGAVVLELQMESVSRAIVAVRISSVSDMS
jgi:hypothetical protein